MRNIYRVSENSKYQLFGSVECWLEKLVQDIKQAQHYIYIETFRLNDDAAGQILCEALIEQAEKGIEVKLIVDSWGTWKTPLFDRMEKSGISIRYFKKLVFHFQWFSKNHERNHRKIIAIDDHISYIGSANFSKYSFKWRESILRIDDIGLSKIFKLIFLENYKIYKKKFKSPKYKKTITYNGFKIIRETPSIMHQRTRNYFIRLITSAKKQITIITPYFVNGKPIREKLADAVKRGVKVTVIVPKHSDVRSVDFLRDLFLGGLHNKGIDIRYFHKGNLHAKLMLIDDHVFAIGSTNFDYRSFRYMYEINMSGQDEDIAALVFDYIIDTLTECDLFNYGDWAGRPFIEKLIGVSLFPIRKLI